MKLRGMMMLACSALMATSCGPKKGAELTLENVSKYLDFERFEEGSVNASYSSGQVTFDIYPATVIGGKLFSNDIKGKCSFTVKYSDGSVDSSFHLIWGEPQEVSDVEFVYEQSQSEEGRAYMDYLKATYTYETENRVNNVNVYNLTITEISGHMLP